MEDFLDRPTDFNELLLRLYRLSQELPIQHFQDAALAQIKHVLPFDSAVWGTAAICATGVEVHMAHLHELSAEMLLTYERFKDRDTALGLTLGQPSGTYTFNTQHWYGAAHQKEIRDFFERFGLNNFFVSTEKFGHQKFAHGIILYRANREALCGDAERRMFSQIAPHVKQALAMNRMLHMDRLEEADRALSPYGTAIADTRGMIYHVDPLFRALVEAEWQGWDGLTLPTDFLLSLHQSADKFIGRHMVARSHIEHSLLFLTARPRCLADQLTLREHTIALRIAKGESHKEIAKALGRSPATVRNQIQGLYDKLQVGSIATLIEALRLAE